MARTGILCMMFVLFAFINTQAHWRTKQMNITSLSGTTPQIQIPTLKSILQGEGMTDNFKSLSAFERYLGLPDISQNTSCLYLIRASATSRIPELLEVSQTKSLTAPNNSIKSNASDTLLMDKRLEWLINKKTMWVENIRIIPPGKKQAFLMVELWDKDFDKMGTKELNTFTTTIAKYALKHKFLEKAAAEAVKKGWAFDKTRIRIALKNPDNESESIADVPEKAFLKE